MLKYRTSLRKIRRYSITEWTVLVCSSILFIYFMYSAIIAYWNYIREEVNNINLFGTGDELPEQYLSIIRTNNNSEALQNFHNYTRPNAINKTSSRRSSKFIKKDILEDRDTSFNWNLLPHINTKTNMTPSYYLKSRRYGVDLVIGVPTVSRDIQSYLSKTIAHLLHGITAVELESILIVVYIGESDLEIINTTVLELELMFTLEFVQNVIEIVAPPENYYPDFDSMKESSGIPFKELKWKIKRSLDAAYLMAHASSRGAFFLMLEDDVLSEYGYLKILKSHTEAVSVINPDWFCIDFGEKNTNFGKLYKAADLLQFVTYILLFYKSMSSEFLLLNYIQTLSNNTIYPNYKDRNHKNKVLLVGPQLFKHAGIHSSLKGKINKIDMPMLENVDAVEYLPHVNPNIMCIKNNLNAIGNHTLKRTYKGLDYFMGSPPSKGSYIEFWFTDPFPLRRYLLRSGNVNHINERFKDTIVQILVDTKDENFTTVGEFDLYGLAEGTIYKAYEYIIAVRLEVQKNITNNVVLSEIDFVRR